MKRIALFTICTLSILGQTLRGQGAGSQFTQKTVLTAAGSTPAIDNLTQGCTAWSMGVFVTGFSGETTTLQDYTGAAWESFAGTAVIGSNPTTTTTYYLFTGTGFYPQVRATLSGLTGSGTVTVFLSCWKSPNYIASLGGSSITGGTCTSQVVTALSTAGLPTCTSLTGAYLPNPSATTLGGTESLAAITHDFLTSISTSGVPVQAQPACGDLSDSVATCNVLGGAAAFVWNNGGAVPTDNGAVVYALPWNAAFGSVAGNSQILMPFTGHVKNLFVTTTATQPGTGSMVITLYTCTPSAGTCTGSSTAVTITIAAGTTINQFSDTSHSFAVTAGDVVLVHIVNNSTSAAPGMLGGVFQLTY